MKPHEEAVWCEECAHLICVCFLSAAQLDVDYLQWVTSSNTDEVGLTPNMKLSSVATYFKTITSHEEANAALVTLYRRLQISGELSLIPRPLPDFISPRL